MPKQPPIRVTGNACFFYGTLMSPKVLSRVIYGNANPEPWQSEGLRIRSAILHDYCRHQVRDADYPGIIKEQGESVRGSFVTGLNAGDMCRLDAFEGREYSRKMVKVIVLDESGREVEKSECHTYVYNAEEGLVKAEWSFEEFVSKKINRWIDESEEYSDVVDTVDPLGGRQWQDGFLPDSGRGPWSWD